MRGNLLFLIFAILFAGCAQKETLSLDDNQSVHVYVTKVDDVFFKQKKARDILRHFPFLTMQKNVAPRGKFSDEFYASIDYVYVAKDIKDVDFWELEKEPKSVDFIYVKPLWMKEYRKLTPDLLSNLAYSLNIGHEEQEILKDWIRAGGVLWVESGVYSTKYDYFTKTGEIATNKINQKIREDLDGLTFLGKPIKTYTFKSKTLDIVNYEPISKEFSVHTTIPFFKDIHKLRLDLTNYMQNYFVILDKTILEDDTYGPVVTYTKYGKGYVVSLLPFDYQDVYYDGELLRWKLFYYLLKNKGH